MSLSSRQSALLNHFQSIRSTTERLCEGLTSEDMVAQSMPDCSPSKWHLAHTSWFFEEFVLQAHKEPYAVYCTDFLYLFNSYYESCGKRHARPQRGLLTRPDLNEVLRYRQHINREINSLLERDVETKVLDIIEIGLHHEMQHQELLLTDILHLFSLNPMRPALRERLTHPQSHAPTQIKTASSLTGGLINIGVDSWPATQHSNFAYDNESPQHQFWLNEFKIQNHLVSNEEWIMFIEDSGYHNPLLWLSDGWSCKNAEKWQAPLYWEKIDGQWFTFGLDGLHSVDLAAPVCHISYYEADAFARWAGKRLPLEQEWEHAAKQLIENSNNANFLEKLIWRPVSPYSHDFQINQQSGDSKPNNTPRQMYGDVWEWTASPYTAYPGFSSAQGALGEYNGKFMANQFVLRGGSCVTPSLQMRPSYRNFFYPHQRWQFSGLRLAS